MEFLIKKGNYYCNNWVFGLHYKMVKQIEKVKFDSSCLYTPFDKENDWNKGTGFTYGIFDDANSLRWGWRQHPDFPKLLQVCLYMHYAGIIYTSAPINVYTETEYYISVENDIKDHAVAVTIIDKETGGKNFSQCEGFSNVLLKPTIGYINRPYFGGDNAAPHDIKININKI